MKRILVLVHGAWATPHVWRHWRQRFEAGGWHVVAPALRHHDGEPLSPHPDLAALSVEDYAEDLAARIVRLPAKPVVVGHGMGGVLALKMAARGLVAGSVLLAPTGIAGLAPPAFWRRHLRPGWSRGTDRPTFELAARHLFNAMTDRLDTGREYGQLVHESGRALLETAYPALDRRKVALVDPSQVAAPLLLVGGGKDRLVPARHVRKLTTRFAHAAEHHEFPKQGHWMPGQPGWQDVAGLTEDWIGRVVEPANTELGELDRRRAWRAAMVGLRA